MCGPLVTVAVVPGERFSLTQRSLENILASTEQRLDLIYVDGGSPAPEREYLERQADRHRFRLFRADDYLSPNVARNLAAVEVRTKYVVFVDSDVLVSRGWLEPLVDCAESTGAWVVGPVCCEARADARIHMAGGAASIFVEEGRRLLHESHGYSGRALAAVGSELRRRPTQQIDFHCALLRTDVFARLGPLDEALLSAREHTDLCLLARGSGGDVYLEPRSVVTCASPPLETSDLPYFRSRWSHARNEASIERFQSKWDLAVDDPGLASLRAQLTARRRRAMGPWSRVLDVLGRKSARWQEERPLAPVEEAANRARFSHGHGARAIAATKAA